MTAAAPVFADLAGQEIVADQLQRAVDAAAAGAGPGRTARGGTGT
jgi:hypothetical protein